VFDKFHLRAHMLSLCRVVCDLFSICVNKAATTSRDGVAIGRVGSFPGGPTVFRGREGGGPV